MFLDCNLHAAERMKKLLVQRLSKIDYTVKDKNWIKNQEYIAFCESSIQALKVTSGAEAMELLINSERVFVDLLSAITVPELFKVKLIIREWTDELPYSMEFRGFVYNNNLNALSQYDYTAFYPHLLKNKENIAKSVRDFFDSEVKKKLESFKNYVIDFGILNSGKVIVIELNPVNVKEVV